MVLEVRNLGRRFPDGRWGLQEVDFSLVSGEFVLLTGHNGSGKSLLIRHIFGLEKAEVGSLHLNGTPLGKDFSTLRSRAALVFQEPEHQILGLTVKEDLEFTLKNRKNGKDRGPGLDKDRRQALEAVGLTGFDDHLTAFLSGGEKRRLAIATALMSDPELLVLDEPFNGLDWPGTKLLLQILQELHRRGLAILVVTHDLEKCLGLADRMVVMKDGRKILDGNPGDLWDDLPGAGLRRPALPASEWKKLSWLN